MIAYCGLVCSDCPTYLATQTNDDLARERTASYYSKQFGFDIKPAEINCDGCKSDGILIAYCLACDLSPDAKISFRELRRNLGLFG